MTAGGAGSRRAADDSLIKRVLELVLLGLTVEAEAALRELNAARRHGLNHRHSQQIRRIEEYFRQHAGRPAWPENFQPGQLIHFRDILGGLLECAPLRVYLEDLKAECGDKQSLLYFVSTEQGKRASRWEMLALRHREEQHEQEKQRFAAEATEAYARLFPVVAELGKPSWVVKLEDEAKRLERLLPLLKAEETAMKMEMRERLGMIRSRLAHWQSQAQAVGTSKAEGRGQ